jgi:hypothetical protein
MGFAGSYRPLDSLRTNKSHDLHDFIDISFTGSCTTTDREVGRTDSDRMR